MKNKGAALLAFLVPGAGHFVQGRWLKGLQLLSSSILVLTALVYYANTAYVQHVLLLVMLGLCLPAIYFYSVYDCLQLQGRTLVHQRSSLRQERWRVAAGPGLALMLIGAALLVFIAQPAPFVPLLEDMGQLGPGLLMIGIAVGLLARQWEGRVRAGRLTASLLSAAAGGLLLQAAWTGKPLVPELEAFVRAWPLVAVGLGLEVTLLRLRNRARPRRRYALDWVGLCGVLLFCGAAYAAEHVAELQISWLDQYEVAATDYSAYPEEEGMRFVKPPVAFELPPLVTELLISNTNGQIHVRGGDVAAVHVEASVWVKLDDWLEAERVAAAAGATISEQEGVISIVAEGPSYGHSIFPSGYKPRINLVVTVPWPSVRQLLPEARIGMRIKTTSGRINAFDLNVPGGLAVETGRGDVNVQRLRGNAGIGVRSGSIRAADIGGSVNLQTVSGNLMGIQIEGDVHAKSTNGHLELRGIGGAVEAEAKNGSITIDGVERAVHADTLNGNIFIKSARIGGQWTADSAVGNIELSFPVTGSARILATVVYGEISTELPLRKAKQSATGQLGEGRFAVEARAGGNVTIRYIDKSKTDTLQ